MDNESGRISHFVKVHERLQAPERDVGLDEEGERAVPFLVPAPNHLEVLEVEVLLGQCARGIDAVTRLRRQ